VINGIPIWEEMREIALRTNPMFLLNVTLDTQKQLTGIFAGNMLSAHVARSAFVAEHSLIETPCLYDVVIATNSGYPLDQNLYQTVKGMSVAVRIVHKGGAVIMVSACQDGLPRHGSMLNC
jgi:lactate racemase